MIEDFVELSRKVGAESARAIVIAMAIRDLAKAVDRLGTGDVHGPGPLEYLGMVVKEGCGEIASAMGNIGG